MDNQKFISDLLKPCPFCGGEAKLVKRKFKVGFYPSGGTYYVHCKKCLITTQPRASAEPAIEAWNRREKNLAVIDAEGVKHAKRLTDKFGMERTICSICGAVYEGGGSFRFCPKCGAKFD